MRQLLLIHYLIATALIGSDDRLLRACCYTATVAYELTLHVPSEDEQGTLTNLDPGAAEEGMRKRTKFVRLRLLTDLQLVRETPAVASAVPLPQQPLAAALPITRSLCTWFCVLLI